MYMDGQLILRKARGLLHQFRQFPKIPCTLTSLCRRCGPGIWDSGKYLVIQGSFNHKVFFPVGHHPAVECIGHEDIERCALADN